MVNEIKAKLVLDVSGSGTGSALGSAATSPKSGGAGGFLGKSIKEFSGGFKKLGATLMGPLMKIVALLKPLAIFGTLMLAAFGAGFSLAALIDKLLITPLKMAFEKIFSFSFGEQWEKELQKYELAKEHLSNIWDTVKEQFNAFKEWVSNTWVIKLFGFLKQKYTDYNNWLIDKWTKLWTFLKSPFQGFIDWIMDKLSFFGIGGNKSGGRGGETDLDNSKGVEKTSKVLANLNTVVGETTFIYGQADNAMKTNVQYLNTVAGATFYATTAEKEFGSSLRRTTKELKEQERLLSSIASMKDKGRRGRSGTSSRGYSGGTSHRFRKEYGEEDEQGRRSVSGYSRSFIGNYTKYGINPEGRS